MNDADFPDLRTTLFAVTRGLVIVIFLSGAFYFVSKDVFMGVGAFVCFSGLFFLQGVFFAITSRSFALLWRFLWIYTLVFSAPAIVICRALNLLPCAFSK